MLSCLFFNVDIQAAGSIDILHHSDMSFIWLAQYL